MGKVTLKSDWFDAIREDETLGGISEEQMAYIIYAATMYGFTGEKVNIGNVFGKEFAVLNFCMTNIYSQIDRIKVYSEEQGKVNEKYDADAIKELKINNPQMTAKEICRELGYPESKAKSITTNKGWLEAQSMIKSKNIEIVQKLTDSVKKSVQKETENVQKLTDIQTESTENVQKKTDVQTENTESTESVLMGVSEGGYVF